MISNQLILHNFKTLFFNYYLNKNSNIDGLFYKKKERNSVFSGNKINA